MSRLIKQYPYLERYQDTMEAFAGSVEKLQVKGVEFDVIKDGTISPMRARVKFKAYEDKKGVFISFWFFEVLKDSVWQEVKKIKSTEFYCDEVEVCDAVYDAVKNGTPVAESTVISNFVCDAAVDIIPAAIKKEGYQIWQP